MSEVLGSEPSVWNWPFTRSDLSAGAPPSLAGAGRREVGVYQSLATQIPLRTPALVAASSAGDWLVLDWVRSVREPGAWKPEDYARALENLAQLHDRSEEHTSELQSRL